MSHQIFTDKQLQNLSLDELKKIVSKEKKDLRKDYKVFQKKKILIEKYKKMRNIRTKINPKVDKKPKVVNPKVDKNPKLLIPKLIKNPKLTKNLILKR